MIDISIILPIHNEEKEITLVINTIDAIMKKNTIAYELLCVENGSTDNSLQVLQTLKKQNSHIHILQSEKGWGNAVRKGITKAKGKFTCYLVSDGQIDPQYIATLYKKIIEKPRTIIKIARIKRESKMRLFNSKIFNMLSSSLFGITSTDINGTPKIIDTQLLKTIPFTSENVSFDLELLLFCKKNNLSLIELPVISQKRNHGTSTTNWKTVCEMLKYMIVFFINQTYRKKYATMI